MTRTANIATFRTLTPAIIASQQLAMATDIVETTKSVVAIALKKAAPALGIDGTAYHILDILIGLTSADDWSQDRRPLVAISNEKLSQYVNRSTRTVTRCLKRLVEAGILSYRDSPTGRRYIHRNDFKQGKYGEIQRGFGLDFSPARQRVHELQGIGAAFADRLTADKDAQRAVNSLRRAIGDMAVLADQEDIPFQTIQNSLEAMEGKAMGNEAKAEVLNMIYEAATALFETSFKEANMSSAGDTSGTPYNHTNPKTLKKSSNERRLADANHSDLPDLEHIEVALSFDEIESGKSQAKPQAARQMNHPEPAEPAKALGHNQGNAHVNSLSAISIGMIDSAAVQTKDMLGDGFACWADLVDASEQLRLAIGLSVDGWKQAVAALGQKWQLPCWL